MALNLDLICGDMVKCTMKVRIISKYTTHYGVSLREMVKKIEKASTPSTHARSVAKLRWKGELWASDTMVPT